MRRCSQCRSGTMKPDTATLTLERGSTTLVLKDVPATVCEQCGYKLFDEKTSARALGMLSDAVSRGVQVEVVSFAAANEAEPVVR